MVTVRKQLHKNNYFVGCITRSKGIVCTENKNMLIRGTIEESMVYLVICQ